MGFFKLETEVPKHYSPKKKKVPKHWLDHDDGSWLQIYCTKVNILKCNSWGTGIWILTTRDARGFD